MTNLFHLPELPIADELTTVLTNNANVRIERIVSTGQVTGWLDQEEEEFVALLDGRAVIDFEDGKAVTLEKGDTLTIKPHERHRVSYTSSSPPCVWLCVFYIP